MGALGAAAAFAADLRLRLPAQLTFSGTFALDGITTWTTLAILASTALVIGLSPRWFATDRRHGEWYAVLLFGALGATLLAGAADLMELMVAMLLTTVAGYTQASYHRASSRCAEAGAKLYFLGALANPLMFTGIVLLYGAGGTTVYRDLGPALTGADPIAVGAGAALVLVGLLFELGAAPVHPWVPDVAEASPAPAAAFLTVAPKVAALVAIARLCSILPADAIAWRPAVAALAALTMTLGNLAALWQDDVRRLLGWSSVSQAGYGLMAVVALGRSTHALPALVVFVAGYALANTAAFAVVVALRGRTSLSDYRGLGRRRPWLAAALAVALLSLVGIPPLVGFPAKLLLFGATIEAGYAWLAVLAVVNTVISVFYYVRVIGPMVLARPPERAPLLGRLAPATALFAAAATLAAGLSVDLLVRAAAASRRLPG
ncbi:MAG: NADH-quinone oxidoreductase subunit N [Myxococcales bacterium]|nr:NADH-quinone oxidoreductase subunit N [Myxococcales bacterium]